VAAVEAGSPAEQAGLKAGDMVVALDGVTIAGADDLIRALVGDRIGRNVELEILRNGVRQRLSVLAGERRTAERAAGERIARP
jgi:S1-C subfamily serine protease